MESEPCQQEAVESDGEITSINTKLLKVWEVFSFAGKKIADMSAGSRSGNCQQTV